MCRCINRMALLCAIAAGMAVAAVGDGIPFSAIRLRKPQTDRPEVWKATLEQFAKHRAGGGIVDP